MRAISFPLLLSLSVGLGSLALAGNRDCLTYAIEYEGGQARAERSFDRNGRPLHTCVYSEAGARVQWRDGWGRTQFSFAARAAATEPRYFDVNGAPVRARFGPHRVVRSRDAHGNLLEEKCLGS